MSADNDDVRLRLLLTTEAGPGPAPAGEVKEAAPGQDNLQLSLLGLPRAEGGAVQVQAEVEEDEVDGPVVYEAEEVAGGEVGVASVVPDIKLEAGLDRPLITAFTGGSPAWALLEVSLHQSSNIFRHLSSVTSTGPHFVLERYRLYF